mgnify:CR=1 FL=1
MARNRQPHATVLGMELVIGESASMKNQLPRIHSKRYDLRDATLRGIEDRHFIAATPKSHATVPSAKSLTSTIRRLDEGLPVVICLERMDAGLKQSLVRENIPFISEDGNVYLPFLGIQETPLLPIPAPLSPQAQRIALNLAAGRWAGVTASELAELCGKSKASITKYLREIEAIGPSLISTSGKNRVLDNSGKSREELLDLFEPYLVNPVKTRYRLTTPIDADVLANHNARLSGLSALPFFSDLAHDPSRLVVEISHEDIVALRGALGDAWQETAWSENASLIIEEWSYPIDVPSNSSMTCTNLECVDPWSLYAELISERFDDVRVEDAIEQLREHLYR